MAAARFRSMARTVDRGTEYGGVDVVVLDADAAGLASAVVQGSRPPTGEQLPLLRAVESDLRRVIESVPESAKPYFEHLLRLVRAVIGRASSGNL